MTIIPVRSQSTKTNLNNIQWRPATTFYFAIKPSYTAINTTEVRMTKTIKLTLLSSAILLLSIFSNAEPENTADRKLDTLREKINIIINFDVKPENIAIFRGILDNVKINLPNVTGCETVSIYADQNNPDKFTLIETWESKEAHQNHITSIVESGDWSKILSNLKTEPSSSYFIQH